MPCAQLLRVIQVYVGAPNMARYGLGMPSNSKRALVARSRRMRAVLEQEWPGGGWEEPCNYRNGGWLWGCKDISSGVRCVSFYGGGGYRRYYDKKEYKYHATFTAFGLHENSVDLYGNNLAQLVRDMRNYLTGLRARHVGIVANLASLLGDGPNEDESAQT